MPVLVSIVFGALLTLATAWMLGNVCLHRLPVPGTIAIAVGAAAESTLVFLMLVCRAGHAMSFALLVAGSAALYWQYGRNAPRLADPAKAPADRISIYVAGAVLALYTALYLINALAPELEPDARAYHLGLTAEYVRLAALPRRVGFYEMLPQGLEMLFVPAFAFGRHSAARLVHCAFLLATIPLLLSIGRRLALPHRVTLAAAALYFCSPVVGITGTSAYTDAGGVFFTLATFYLLLVWRDTRDARYLAPAGITAGFCYAIKFPGALVVILAMLFVIATERRLRPRHLLLLAGAALLMAAPWIVRAAVMTGNPAAPLFNSLFPNACFHRSTERDLAAALASLWGVPRWHVPYELIVGGTFGGILGPVFFALPLALLALRRSAGRLCWLAAALLALPWFWNTGTRFLMPALPFLALALAIALPRPAAWICVALEAVLCWPQIYALYHPAYTWRLERIPWRAALRIQSDRDYLESTLPAYHVATLIEDHTQPGEKVFSLISVPTAYTDRDVLEYWHSAAGDTLYDALRAAAANEALFDVRAGWTPRRLSGLRIRAPRASTAEWQIAEITLLSGNHELIANPRWQLDGWPEMWDVPLAFDRNLATNWRTREPIRAGMFVEVDFEHPQTLSGAIMTTPTGAFPIDFYGVARDRWQLLSSHPAVTANPPHDLRVAATRAVGSAGFRYILADYGENGNASLGATICRDTALWGLEGPVKAGPLLLFRIK